MIHPTEEDLEEYKRQDREDKGLAHLEERRRREPPIGEPCGDCDGCGKVADTERQEPWTQWLSLPLESSAAVLMGLVKPIECPRCLGTGVEP